MAPDDEETALKIQENLKSAVSNSWPRPYELGALAGTVPCPSCYGNPKVHRLTPDFGKAFNLDEPWDFKVAKRMGSYSSFAVGPKLPYFMEYPSSPPVPLELPAPAPRNPIPGLPTSEPGDVVGVGVDDGFKMSHTSAFSLEDYVLNYASDDDQGI